MDKIRFYFFAVSIVLAVASFSADSQTNPQTVFELEGSVRSPVSIPADVIAVLKSDKRVDTCFKTAGAGVDEQTWFEAAEFDLNDDQRADLVIKPKNACLFGANQGPFWIFQNAKDGYQKILSASGLQLTILPDKFNSFRSIAVGKAVGMRGVKSTFRFSKGKYQLAK